MRRKFAQPVEAACVYHNPGARVRRTKFSPAGRLPMRGTWVITGLAAILAWNQVSAAEAQGAAYALKGHKDAVMSVAVSPDGRWIASGSRDRMAIVWDVQRRAIAHLLPGHADGVTAVAFSAD